MRRLCPALLTAALVLLPAAVSARVIVVAQDGSGAHRSISEGVAAAKPGDTVRVKAGVYRETVRMSVEGIVLEGRGAVIDGGGADGVWPSDRSTVRGFVITGCDDAVFVTSRRQGVVIENNTILFNDGEGITLMYELGSVTLRNNIIWRNTDGIFNQGKNPVDAHHNLVFENSANDYYSIGPGAGDLRQSPLLVNPGNRDYRLREDSPARRAGADGVDLGAFLGDGPVEAADAAPAATPAEALPAVRRAPRVSLEVQFVDAGGDGRLSPGEAAAVTVTVHNRGLEAIGGDEPLEVRASLVRAPRGVTLGAESSRLGVIASGRDGAVSFPLQAGERARLGKRPVAVRIEPVVRGGGALPAVVLEIPVAR